MNAYATFKAAVLVVFAVALDSCSSAGVSTDVSVASQPEAADGRSSIRQRIVLVDADGIPCRGVATVLSGEPLAEALRFEAGQIDVVWGDLTRIHVMTDAGLEFTIRDVTSRIDPVVVVRLQKCRNLILSAELNGDSVGVRFGPAVVRMDEGYGSWVSGAFIEFERERQVFFNDDGRAFVTALSPGKYLLLSPERTPFSGVRAEFSVASVGALESVPRGIATHGFRVNVHSVDDVAVVNLRFGDLPGAWAISAGRIDGAAIICDGIDKAIPIWFDGCSLRACIPGRRGDRLKIRLIEQFRSGDVDGVSGGWMEVGVGSTVQWCPASQADKVRLQK